MNQNQPISFEKWDYDGQFLSWYPRAAQSTVANWFCYAVRDGATMVHQILQQVEYQAIRRKGRASEAVTEEVLDQLIDDLNSDEARDFAAFILWRESLPVEEKTRLKAESGKQHVNNYMAQEAATGKQLSYLKSLGCKTVPQSKLEASQLIEQHLSAKAGAR